MPSVADPDAGLRPAEPTRALAELSACLTLCAPTGMNAADRKEWLSVAFQRIADIPADLLIDAVRHAQETCDHPAKIVPAVIAHSRENWERRRMLSIEARRRSIVVADEPTDEEPDQPFSQADVDCIVEERGRMLSCCMDNGTIVKRDGKFVPGKPVRGRKLA